MSSLIARVAGDATAPIERLGIHLLTKAALFALAMISAVVSGLFLTIALYMVLEQRAGTFVAILGVGGLYLAVAIALVVAAVLSGQGEASQQAEKADPSGPVTAARETSPQPHPDMARALDRIASPLLDLLDERGLERERLALAAGITVAKELRPWMLVGLVLAIGTVAGHFLQRRYS